MPIEVKPTDQHVPRSVVKAWLEDLLARGIFKAHEIPKHWWSRAGDKGLFERWQTWEQRSK